MCKSILFDFNTFNCTTDSQDLNHVIESVRKQSDDEQTIKQIDRDSMRGAHLYATDFTDAAVGSQDDDGG